MTIKILFAKAIKPKTSNYRWLDYEGFGYFGKETWTKTVEDYWNFESWLLKRFANERVDKRDFQNINKVVLVLTPGETLSDYEFFRCDGELANLYNDNKLDALFDEYSNDRE
mgnify:CR=1 FL=1